MPEIGYGVTLSVSDAFPATNPTNSLGGITGFTPPNPTRDFVDVTDSASPNRNRVFIPGLTDNGEAGFTINWDLGSAPDVLLRSLATETTVRTYRATFNQYSPARTMTFTAHLASYEREAPFDDKMTASITLKVSGPVVYA